VDVTFGGGGHSKAILDQLTTGTLFAFDQDPDAKNNLPDHLAFSMIQRAADTSIIFIPPAFAADGIMEVGKEGRPSPSCTI